MSASSSQALELQGRRPPDREGAQEWEEWPGQIEENQKWWREGHPLHQSWRESEEPSTERTPVLSGDYAGEKAATSVPLLLSDQMALSSSQPRAEQELPDGKMMFSCV